MTFSFDGDIATKYGMMEAILFQNIGWWVKKNRANNDEFSLHDGRYWTYNSVAAYGDLFPFASKYKIGSALKHLEREGLVATGNYSDNPLDRRTWYTLTDAGEALFNWRGDSAVDRFIENQKCIPGNREMQLAIPGNVNSNNNSSYNYTVIKHTVNKNKETRARAEKLRYAEFVTLSEDEHSRLVDKYGGPAAERMIEVLDNYKGASGKRYKSDYRAILTWVVDKVTKEGVSHGAEGSEFVPSTGFRKRDSR